MSNSTLERVFKLWIQLWELVLEEKRNLDAVCAVLQNLIFEFKGYPQFRNWKEICKLSDWCLKMVLARTDLASLEGKRLQSLFPECFTYEKNRGAIPLSILREYSRSKGHEEEPDRSTFLEITGTLGHFGVPFITLGIKEEGDRDVECDVHVTPDEVEAMGVENWSDLGEDFGKIVRYQDHDYFVAETSGCYQVYLVPVEALLLDQ